MNRTEATEVVKMLQTFWPIEWSQRMSRQIEERLADAVIEGSHGQDEPEEAAADKDAE